MHPAHEWPAPPPEPWRGSTVTPAGDDVVRLDGTARERRSAWRARVMAVVILLAGAAGVGGIQWTVDRQEVAAVRGPDRSELVLRPAPEDPPRPGVTGRDAPTPGFGETGAPLALPPPTPPGTSYAFMDEQTDPMAGTVPVSWSPCRPIHVVLNPRDTPDGFEDELVRALGTISAATGLVFAYEGHTDERPVGRRPSYQPERYGDRWAPVLVEVADPGPEQEDLGDVLGWASVQPATVPGSSTLSYVTGRVVVVPSQAHAPAARWGPPYVSTLLHELGHLVGLDHVDDRGQLMGSPHWDTVRTLQDGDLAGLARLGSAPCAPGL